MYIVVNPVRLAVDYLTLVWLNAFSLNLLHSLVSGSKGLLKEEITSNFVKSYAQNVCLLNFLVATAHEQSDFIFSLLCLYICLLVCGS